MMSLDTCWGPYVPLSRTSRVRTSRKLAVAILKWYEQVALRKEAVEVLDVDVVASDEVIR